MKSNQITYIFLGVIGILGWNAWAIQRDAKLFEAYDYQKAKVEFCHDPQKGMTLYNYALKMLNKLDCVNC